MNVATIQTRLVEFLHSVTGQRAISTETDLIESGIADSLTMMDLMVFIETDLQVRLDFSDLVPDVFRTPATIANLLAARLERKNHARAA